MDGDWKPFRRRSLYRSFLFLPHIVVSDWRDGVLLLACLAVCRGGCCLLVSACSTGVACGGYDTRRTLTGYLLRKCKPGLVETG